MDFACVVWVYFVFDYFFVVGVGVDFLDKGCLWLFMKICIYLFYF